jgi:2,5-diketo-D-gluconate reductase A
MVEQTSKVDGMPTIGLGTWQLGHETAKTISDALNIGYRLIDTSGDYGTQPGIGQGMQMSGVRRESIYLQTKIEETDNAYEALRKNLEELQQQYVDLALIHRPPMRGAGLDLWDGLRRAKSEGLTKHIGVSNYSINLIKELIGASGEVPLVNQIEWTPFGHSDDMFGFCQENAIIIQAYSPLTRGRRLNDETLVEIAANYNKSPAQVLIRWCMQLGTVPIVKANDMDHLRENYNVFDFEISDDDMATLNGLNDGYSAFGSLPYL